MRCNQCEGSGYSYRETNRKCPACRGTGDTISVRPVSDMLAAFAAGLSERELAAWFQSHAPNVKYTTDATNQGLLVVADFGYGVKVNRTNVDYAYLERCLRDVGKRHLGG